MAYDPNTDNIDPTVRKMLDVYVECIVWNGTAKHDAAVRAGADPSDIERWIRNADADDYTVWKLAHESAKLDPAQWTPDAAKRYLLRMLNDPWIKPAQRIQALDRLNVLNGITELDVETGAQRLVKKDMEAFYARAIERRQQAATPTQTVSVPVKDEAAQTVH